MAESQETPTQVQETEPQKMSPEEFQQKLAAGEIDTSADDPSEVIEKLVDFGEKSEEPQPQPALGEVKEPVEEPEPPKAEEPKAPEPQKFQNFGELMAAAKEELGEDIPSARDLIVKAKNQKEHLQKLQTAVERWKADATARDARVAELEAKLANAAKEVPVAPTATQQPAPVAESKEPDFEAEIPEVDKPSEFADADEVAKYFDKERKRDNLIAKKRTEWLQKEYERKLKASEARVKEVNQTAQQKIEVELRKRQEQERIERQRQESFVAASDFVNKHKEFGITDVRDADQKYTNWAGQVDYIKRNNPAYANRDLIADYFNGVSDAVQLLDGYAMSPPEGAKEHAMLIELEKIALQHNFVDSVTGRPNFDEAYALKKVRDGVDIEETNDKVAKAVEQTVDIVQQRQAVPQALGASDVVSPEQQPKPTPEQVQERINQLQAKMSTMRPDEREKAMKEVEELMSVGLGLNPVDTGA